MGNIISKIHEFFYPPRRSDVELLLDQFEYRLSLENFEKENRTPLEHYQKKNFR